MKLRFVTGMAMAVMMMAASAQQPAPRASDDDLQARLAELDAQRFAMLPVLREAWNNLVIERGRVADLTIKMQKEKERADAAEAKLKALDESNKK